MDYVNSKIAKKKLFRPPFFVKNLSLFKGVGIFFIISLKIGFIGIVKYCIFPVLFF